MRQAWNLRSCEAMHIGRIERLSEIRNNDLNRSIGIIVCAEAMASVFVRCGGLLNNGRGRGGGERPHLGGTTDRVKTVQIPGAIGAVHCCKPLSDRPPRGLGEGGPPGRSLIGRRS